MGPFMNWSQWQRLGRRWHELAGVQGKAGERESIVDVRGCQGLAGHTIADPVREFAGCKQMAVFSFNLMPI